MSHSPPEAAASVGRFRPTRVEISVGAFTANVRAFRSLVGAGTNVMAVLKADAYGHGAHHLASAALSAGASMIGVSSIEEGVALRHAGIEAPILLLGSVYPLENFAPALKARLTPSVASLESAQHLAAVAEIAGVAAPFHLKIDTGMGRLGVSPQGARPILEWVKTQKSLRLAGVYSHFSSADSDPDFTAHQLAEFLGVRDSVRSLGFEDVIFHIANSAAALSRPNARLDMVRPGIALYGAPPVAVPNELSFRPVLSWRTSIVFLKRVPAGTTISYSRKYRTEKEIDVATLPVGYGDGVPRSAFGKAQVLVKGRRRPVIGVVTMDHIMVDVTGMSVDVGDDVVLIGRQGEEQISAAEWASWTGTISYEIFCGISKRVPREAVA